MGKIKSFSYEQDFDHFIGYIDTSGRAIKYMMNGD
jgi:hypothetical protein